MSGNPYLQIHISVFLWGFTAILGKVITLAALPLVFWRVSIVTLCLFLWLPVWRQLARVDGRDFRLAVGNGVLVVLHWLCFYGSIKAANASVAATCMALAPVCLSVVEPLWRRQPFVLRDLGVALACIPGVALVVGGIPDSMYWGMLLGVLAAFLAAIFSLINKSLAMRMPAMAVTTIQMSTGAVVLGLSIPAWSLFGLELPMPDGSDLGWLIVLAIACTLLPFALSLVALRKISAFSAQLAVNLEPVYAIGLAALMLGEGGELRWTFYLGVLLILAAVLGYAFWPRARPATGGD